MASRLLNILEDIEHSRKQIIQDARQKNYHLDDDASFDEIGDLFKELPVTEGKLIPMDEAPETLLQKDEIVINNLRNGVGVEQEILDYLETFENTRDVDGYTLAYQMLLDNSSPTITFVAVGNQNGVVTSAIDQIQIGNLSNNYYGDNPVDFMVLTSDGETYNFDYIDRNTNITHMHTWDDTKDINNKRWFKVFMRMHKEADRSRRANYICPNFFLSNQAYMGAIPIIALYKNTLNNMMWNLYYAGDTTYSGKDTLKYLFFAVVNTEDTEDLINYMNTNKPSRQSFNCYVGNSSHYWRNLKLIRYSSPYYSGFPGISTYDGVASPLIDFPIKSIINPSVGTPSSSGFYRNNVRITPFAWNEAAPDEYVLSKNGLYLQTSGNNPHRALKRSWFLNYTGAMPEEFTITKLGDISDAQNRIPIKFIPGSVIEIPDTVTSLGSYALINSGANTGELDLHHIDTIIGPQALSNCYAIMIRLDYVTTLNYTLFDYIYCRELTLNSLRETSARLGNHAFGMLRLDIPELEAYNFTFPESPTIEIINAPKLKHMIEKPFIMTDGDSCFAQLHTLILGEGIETNLNLSTCISLSKESIIDIISKLKDYTEDEQHILTLNDYTYSLLTEEEIQEATDKNWSVIYASAVYN